MSRLKGWFNEHSTLIIFLVAQAAAILAYSVRLETRVTTLEVRGSPHLGTIDNRLTVLESLTHQNKERLDHVVDVLTRELGKDTVEPKP